MPARYSSWSTTAAAIPHHPLCIYRRLSDGANPEAGLIADASGDLFGTTAHGGASNRGTVFELVKSGSSYTFPPFSFLYRRGLRRGHPRSRPDRGRQRRSLRHHVHWRRKQLRNGLRGPRDGECRREQRQQPHGHRRIPLSAPLVVQVTDGAGDPLPGLTVNWAAIGGGGASVRRPASPTPTATPPSMRRSAPSPAKATTCTPPPSPAMRRSLSPSPPRPAPPDLVYVSGDNQSGIAGAHPQVPLVVEATDQFGNPVSGVPVSWAAVIGGGSISPASTTTGANGQTSAFATLGGDTLGNTYTASSGTLSGSPVTFDEISSWSSTPSAMTPPPATAPSRSAKPSPTPMPSAVQTPSPSRRT